jgi:hypothetical protein
VPQRRIGDLFVEDVVDRLRDRRHRATGIDQPRPALADQFPAAIGLQRDILPADFAHAMRGRGGAGGLEIDDADHGRRRGRRHGP